MLISWHSQKINGKRFWWWPTNPLMQSIEHASLSTSPVPCVCPLCRRVWMQRVSRVAAVFRQHMLRDLSTLWRRQAMWRRSRRNGVWVLTTYRSRCGAAVRVSRTDTKIMQADLVSYTKCSIGSPLRLFRTIKTICSRTFYGEWYRLTGHKWCWCRIANHAV